MIRMISKVEHEYAGRTLRPGDEFDCAESDAHLLKVLGRVEPLLSSDSLTHGESLDSGEVNDVSGAAHGLARAASQRTILKRKV